MTVFSLENKFHKVSFLAFGATIYKWEIKPLNNRNIILTNQHFESYLDANCCYFGSTIGRVANRIKDGKFTLNGKTYQLACNFDGYKNAGHGGPHGFWQKEFQVMNVSSTSITFFLLSPHLDESYPGTLVLYVTYTLLDIGLRVDYKAKTTDYDTILNITNHAYFNLDASDNVLNHVVNANLSHYLPYDNHKAVTGEKVSTKGTFLDFSEGVKLEDIIHEPYLQDEKTLGLDHCFYFEDEGRLELEGKDLTLTLLTSYPAIQLYSSSFPGTQPLLGNKKMKQYHALAVEPELPVDAINHPHLGDMTLKVNENYTHFIEYRLELKHE